MVVEFFGLHIRDPKEILYIIDVSYVQKQMIGSAALKENQTPPPVQLWNMRFLCHLIEHLLKRQNTNFMYQSYTGGEGESDFPTVPQTRPPFSVTPTIR